MLSDIEKKEMLEDAASLDRRERFRIARQVKPERISLDEYIRFLNSVQKTFNPFPVSYQPTKDKFNRL